MPTPTSSNHCLRYWDLADHIRIDDAIALWCGVEPAELAKLNFETLCMSAKRAALVTALRNVAMSDEKFSSDNFLAPTLGTTKARLFPPPSVWKNKPSRLVRK